jgi:hypothetical protein
MAKKAIKKYMSHENMPKMKMMKYCFLKEKQDGKAAE